MKQAEADKLKEAFKFLGEQQKESSAKSEKCSSEASFMKDYSEGVASGYRLARQYLEDVISEFPIELDPDEF